MVIFLAGVEIAIVGYPLLWWFSPETMFAVQMAAAWAMLVRAILAIPVSITFEALPAAAKQG